MSATQHGRWHVLMCLTFLLSACSGSEDKISTGSHEAQADASDFERGPHRGRMLRDGDLAVEMTIFEEGVPPEFHVYVYDDDAPLAPDQVRLSVELTRLGGKTDRFTFRSEGGYLKGEGVVKEPHSFDVKVTAVRDSKTSTWSYASYEGRVEIEASAAEAAGLRVEPAGQGAIREHLELTGDIQVDPARVSRVRARFPGLVREVRRGLGDVVASGEVLAVVQGNEGLQNYSINAPISGTVLSRNAVAGEATGDDPLFVIGNLSQLWAELDVFGGDLVKVKVGQPVRIASLDGESSTEGTISALSPLTTHSSQSVRARVVLVNDDMKWRPGQFVHGIITVDEAIVPIAVRNEALQRFRDFTVVFAQVENTYEVRMLELGKSDGVWTEVLGGLEPGERYVAGNSFLIKADIEKSGASHDH